MENAEHANRNHKAMRPRRRLLGTLLQEQGLITAAQLEDALRIQREGPPHKQLGRVLVELDYVKAEEVARILAGSVGLPFTTLVREMVQAEALDILPQEYLEKHNLLPLSRSDGWLTIAVEQFTDVFLTEEISRRSRCRVQVVAAEAENIRETRRSGVARGGVRAGGWGGEVEGGLDEVLDEISVNDLEVVEDALEEEGDLEATASESPIVRLVNYIIRDALDMSASDIHIEPDEATFRVRYRIDGELIAMVRPTSSLLPAIVSRIKILAGMDISERRLPQDGAMTVMVLDRAVDLRVSTMPARGGEKIVMRIVDRDGGIRGLPELGLEPEMLERFQRVVRDPNGIVLVTGPTGSGKTTTLYSVISAISSDARNISTIEDPVERRLSGANQFQVHEELGFTFARALRSLLRQDPDIIMVGEIRDTETARLATEAALTGHLVLSTLHTNDAPTAVPRLVNMGVEPYLVAASLRGVLAQRLVRGICPHCRVTAALTPAQTEIIEDLCAGGCPLQTASIGTGCSACREQGRLGRVALFDLLLVDEELLSEVTSDPGIGALRRVARQQGASGILHDGLIKARRGLIDLEALLEVVSRTEERGEERSERRSSAA